MAVQLNQVKSTESTKSTEPIKGAIFDLDGTLLDSMPIWRGVGRDYLRQRGITAPADFEMVVKPLSLQQSSEYLKASYGLPDTVEKIMADINGLIEDAYRNTLPLKSGAAELLEVLRQANRPMVIATATDRYLVEAALQRNGVLEYFQDIFTCGMVGAGKDQPLIYEMACAALQTKKRETWVFEDALHAIVTAKQAGFPVVAVYDPAFHADQQAIGRLADIHLSSLDEWRLPSNV